MGTDELDALHRRYDGPVPTGQLARAQRVPEPGSRASCKDAWHTARFWARRARAAPKGTEEYRLCRYWLAQSLARWRQERTAELRLRRARHDLEEISRLGTALAPADPAVAPRSGSIAAKRTSRLRRR